MFIYGSFVSRTFFLDVAKIVGAYGYLKSNLKSVSLKNKFGSINAMACQLMPLDGSFNNSMLFWFIFIIKLCRQFFCDCRKKGPRLKWTIFKHDSDNSKKCLTVGNSVCRRRRLCPRSSLHQLM